MMPGHNIENTGIVLRSIQRSAILLALVCYLAWGPLAARLRTQDNSGDSNFASSLSVGQMAPPWITQGWVNSASLDVKQLRSKVILLRFLNDGASGAATLNNLYRTYRSRGMIVVGIYAPTPMPAPTSLEHVRELAASHGFEFPVGLDARWETLNRYWLERADAELTAATFLIDRKGIIRYIQPDGQYEKDSANRALRKEYAKLEKAIDTLLKTDEVKAGEAKEQPPSTGSSGNPRPRETL